MSYIGGASMKKFNYGKSVPSDGYFKWNKQKYLIKKSDKRWQEFQDIKKEWGFTPDECWNLYHTIAVFILPRLVFFKENYGDKFTPASIKELSNEEWQKILDKMIWSFTQVAKEDFDEPPQEYLKNYEYYEACKAYEQDIDEGLDLFREYFLALWY